MEKEMDAIKPQAVYRKIKRFRTRKLKRRNYLDRKIRRRLKRTRKNRNRKQKTPIILTPLQPDIFIKEIAPENFSLVNNTEKVLEYFKNVGKLFDKRNQVEFDLKNITNLTPDAIALLVAKVNDIHFTRNLGLKGNSPKKSDLKKIFVQSGFLNHVKFPINKPPIGNNLLIHPLSHKKVVPEIAKKASLLAVRHTFGDDQKFRPIFQIIIECMANTDNHASNAGEGQYDWWLFVYCDPKNNVSSFTFLDLGIGIFNSNPVNSYRREIQIKLEGLLPLSSDNLSLAPKLFSEGIYTSQTRDKKRGQGLPSIKEHSQNEHIRNFMIISNDVKISLPDLKCELLENKLNGTMLYWELHNN